MKLHNSISLAILISTILFTFHHSQAKRTHPISGKLSFHQWLNTLQTDPMDAQLEFTPSAVIAAGLCFIAALISSAGGTGGGGLFIPILTIVAGFNLKTASTFSAFMVIGGSLANVLCNIFVATQRYGGKMVIDFDITLLSEPCMLLGVSVGVICNRMLPEWLITMLFALFLAWCSLKTCRSGVRFWGLESEEYSRR